MLINESGLIWYFVTRLLLFYLIQNKQFLYDVKRRARELYIFL